MTQNVDDDAGTPSAGVLLLALLGAPLAWTLHLFVSYSIVAVDCATPWSSGRAVVAVATAGGITLSVCSGLVARHVWMRSRAIDRPTDDAWDARMGERTARVSFLMVAGLMLSALFTIAITYAGLSLLFLSTCPAATVN